jgi:23S rRNA (pseudouridine1915-N3)-methyltransferase
LTDRIKRWRDAGRPAAAFVIGGADGLGDALRDRADLTLAFGAATWPHQLVRIMLLEQIYRSATLLAGHPYHRA